MKGYSFDELVKLAEAAVKRAGDTMTGNLTTPKVLVSGAQGAEGNALTRKDYVDSAIAAGDALQVSKSGDTMSGNLTAPKVLVSGAQGTEVNALTRKDYVDTELSRKLSLTGGGIAGDFWRAVGDRQFGLVKHLGKSADAKPCLVLLAKKYVNTPQSKTGFVGRILFSRGATTEFSYTDFVDVSVSVAYIVNLARLLRRSGNTVGNAKIVEVTYNSEVYFALYRPVMSEGEVIATGHAFNAALPLLIPDATAYTITDVVTTEEDYHVDNKPTPANVGAVAKAGDTMTGNLTAPKVLVSGAQGTEVNALTRKDYVDGQVATRAPMAHTHTVAAITDLRPQDANATANTLVLRDGSADVNARLLRTTYANESGMSGAIAFRVNNSTDNFTRYCSNPAAVRNWMRDAKTSWDMDWRAYIEHTDNPMTEYHIPGKVAVITYLTGDGNYRITSSNGAGGAVTDRLRLDSSGNLFTQAAIHEAGQRVYSPNNQPHYSHNHTAAQGNADIVASGHSQIGTYMLAQSRANTVQTPGYTVAGSSLRPAAAGDRYADGQSLPGTWKLLGAIWDESNIVANRTSLWIRIS